MTRARASALAALLAAGALGAVVAACRDGDGAAAAAVPRVLGVTGPGGGLVPDVATGVIAGDGRVLTVAHVLGGAVTTRVAGRPARVVRVDRRADLALLRVRGLHGPDLRLDGGGGDGGDGPVTIRVLRDGRPRALPARIVRRVTARVRDAQGDPPLVRPALQLSAAVAAGDSGAPVLGRDGRLLGIVFARAGDDGATAWAVSASAVRALVDARGAVRGIGVRTPREPFSSLRPAGDTTVARIRAARMAAAVQPLRRKEAVHDHRRDRARPARTPSHARPCGRTISAHLHD